MEVGRVGAGQTGEVGRLVARADTGLVGLEGATEEGRLEPVGRGDHAAVGGNVGRWPGQ